MFSRRRDERDGFAIDKPLMNRRADERRGNPATLGARQIVDSSNPAADRDRNLGKSASNLVDEFKPPEADFSSHAREIENQRRATPRSIRRLNHRERRIDDLVRSKRGREPYTVRIEIEAQNDRLGASTPHQPLDRLERLNRLGTRDHAIKIVEDRIVGVARISNSSIKPNLESIINDFFDNGTILARLSFDRVEIGEVKFVHAEPITHRPRRFERIGRRMKPRSQPSIPRSIAAARVNRATVFDIEHRNDPHEFPFNNTYS